MRFGKGKKIALITVIRNDEESENSFLQKKLTILSRLMYNKWITGITGEHYAGLFKDFMNQLPSLKKNPYICN
ncbi:MAG: hypothetical protein LBQ01_06380 [Prevotellaceae bacterium]|jgi:hypothetical protein|nr:hypothetical protein [Prevotellaceae bacterium]